MSVLDWYATRYWGDTFNERRVINGQVNYHKGTDIQHPGRSWVPALRGGTIVAVNRSSVLGNVISIKPDDYAPGRGYEPHHYAHLWGGEETLEARRARLVGMHVAQGAGFAQLAQRGDVTGTAWTGPHLHFTVGPAEAWAGVNVRNSDDVIRTVLNEVRQAGGGVTPINPTQPTLPKGADMPVYIQATDNSTPLTNAFTTPPTASGAPGVSFAAGHSRIWAGTQTLDGIVYSDVWAYDGNIPRRMTRTAWQAVYNMHLEPGQPPVPLVQLTGNQLEAMIYGRAY